MKLNILKYGIFTAALTLSVSSCGDFLDRPAEDSYNVDNYYQTDAQCKAGVNYLYNSPWYDFQRGFIKVGEVLSGNYYWGSSPYLEFTVNGTDADLVSMSYSLWAVIGHANTVYNSLKASPASQSVRNACMGECLTWKAMAYFYLVRVFGDVPIVHDNTEELLAGTYNAKRLVQKADVYEYIIMTLEKAMELLPKMNDAGRIDYYCAEGLLSKVYLTKAGVSGSLDNDDLNKAMTYAENVIENSGRQLLENYEDVFRLANNKSEESLIAWCWTSEGQIWTAQNTLQSDLGMTGFDEYGDCWGDWQAPSVDLQQAFGVDLLNGKPSDWNNNNDTRIHGTMMLPGSKYDYFWKDKGGFDYLKFIYDNSYNSSAPGQLNSNTGCNSVKHLYGNAQDHVDGAGVSAKYMYSSLATHILRLSDIYLIYAEAKCLVDGGSTTDATALNYFKTVRGRAVKNYWGSEAETKLTTLTWNDVWKERRLEFACEGDRWYDYVRVSYYDPQFCIDELKAQKRNYYNGLNDVYKTYYNEGNGYSDSNYTVDTSSVKYDTTPAAPNVTKNSFTLPFPTEDVVFNPNLLNSEPVHEDVRSLYSY